MCPAGLCDRLASRSTNSSSSSSFSLFTSLWGDFGDQASSWFKPALLHWLQRCQIRGRQSGLLPSCWASICSQIFTRDSLPPGMALKSQSQFSALIHPELSRLSLQAFGDPGIVQVLPTTRTGPSQWTLNHLTYATHNPVYAKTCPRSFTGTTFHTALCCAEGHR